MEPQHAHHTPPEVALPDAPTMPIVEGSTFHLVEPPPQHFFEREDVAGQLPIQRPTRRAVGAPRPQSPRTGAELDVVDDRGLDPFETFYCLAPISEHKQAAGPRSETTREAPPRPHRDTS